MKHNTVPNTPNIIPNTQNPDYGFFGTCIDADLDAQCCWAAAVCEIAAATLQTPEDAAAFLDTRHGRHFADDVVCGCRNGLPPEAAVRAAADKWMGWRIGRQLEGETGIPADWPYLTGLVVAANLLLNIVQN